MVCNRQEFILPFYLVNLSYVDVFLEEKMCNSLCLPALWF
jgi:hypothetical protein